MNIMRMQHVALAVVFFLAMATSAVATERFSFSVVGGTISNFSAFASGGVGNVAVSKMVVAQTTIPGPREGFSTVVMENFSHDIQLSIFDSASMAMADTFINNTILRDPTGIIINGYSGATVTTQGNASGTAINIYQVTQIMEVPDMVIQPEVVDFTPEFPTHPET